MSVEVIQGLLMAYLTKNELEELAKEVIKFAELSPTTGLCEQRGGRRIPGWRISCGEAKMANMSHSVTRTKKGLKWKSSGKALR